MLLAFGLMPTFMLAQADEIKKILTEGVRLFEEGKYQEAIAEYEKVFDIEKNNTAALFEIGYAYYALKDYDKAIKYSDKVIKQGKDNLLEAYNLKGNTLDDTGKPEKAIKVYEEGIKQFPDQYLLYFNLGISHYRIGEHKEAEAALQQAIGLKVNHKSSHFYLGKLKSETKERIPSMLANYFFLLLEPTGERAEIAYDLLQKQLVQGVEKGENGNTTINLSLDQLENEFSTAEMMLGLLVTPPDDLPIEDRSPEGMFAFATDMVFGVLTEGKKDKSGFYWDLYVQVFGKIKEAGQTKAFCYYISQSRSEKAAKWVEENEAAVDALFKLLND
jgi:tetratricopeptide (TPR) repeat protein